MALVGELDTFIAHIDDRAPKPVTDSAAVKIAVYAQRAHHLGP